MGAVGPEAVVQALEVLPASAAGRGRELKIGEGGTEIEARTTDDDGRPLRGEGVVDGRVRQACVFADRGLVIELPHGSQLCGPLGLVRQNRQAPVHLHRVGGDERRRNAGGDGLRNGRLARGGRAEDREDRARERDPHWGHPVPPPALSVLGKGSRVAG